MHLIRILFIGIVIIAISCSAESTKTVPEPTKPQIEVDSAEILQDTIPVSLVPTQAVVYAQDGYSAKKAFIVISKRDLSLSVYAPAINGVDTMLVARYPACMGLNLGQKQRKGDMKTPESGSAHPFKIIQIQPSGTWKHDFGDGRGAILSYGKWFLRLNTPPHKGIGIHGSTNNEETVPGRASEGCIRLRDADIQHLKTNYAYMGMPVYVKGEDEGLYPYEPENPQLLISVSEKE